MAPDQSVNLTMSSDSNAPRHVPWTPQKSRPDQQAQRPGPHARRPISPPALSRPVSSSGQRGNIPMHPAPASRGQLSGHEPGEDIRPSPMAAGTNADTAARKPQSVTSPAQDPSRLTHGTPKHQTPRKSDWTTDKMEDALRIFAQEMGKNNARNSAHSIHDAWKKMAPEPVPYSKKNWFAEMKRVPTEPGKGTLKLKLKVCHS